MSNLTANTLQTAYHVSIEIERYIKESIAAWKLAGECLPALVGMLRSDYKQMIKVISIPVFIFQGFYGAFSKDVESFVSSHIPTEDELIQEALDSTDDDILEVLTVFVMALVEVLKVAVKTLSNVPQKSIEWKQACKLAGIKGWSKLKITDCQEELIKAGYVW